jgi:hypothetical protein
MSTTNSLAIKAKLALYQKYGSLWKAAAAIDSQYSGAWLLHKLLQVPADPRVAMFVQKEVGIDLTAAPEHQEAANSKSEV